MKLQLPFLGLIGVYNALTLSDELKALVNFDQWAQTSMANHNFSGKVPASTARAAQRLRAMRADLLTLLANVPPNPPKQQMDDEKSQLFDNANNEMIMHAKLDNHEGSTSGDWDVDVKQLMSDNDNSRDIAIMVRHGLLDDMMQNANVDFGNVQTNDKFSATIIEPENDKVLESQYSEQYDADDDAQIIEDNVPVASLDDMPTFDKVIYSHHSPRQPKLVTGENSAGTSGKSQWLTLSVVGSLAAIVLTVTLTVFARRIKSGKNNDSGTPVQKLRRFNLKNSPQSQQIRGQQFRAQQFSGHNSAYRPQSMDSGVHDYSTNSSQISTSSGSFVPQRQQQRQNTHAEPNRQNTHVVNFAHEPNRQSHIHPNYPNRNRALPPPPYSKIEY